MRRFYNAAANRLERYPWGQSFVEHVRHHTTFYEFVDAIIFAVVFALIIRTFLLQPFKIPSDSMIPTLQVNDRIFVYRLPYWFRKVPEVGDVVVFKTPKAIYDPEKPIYIKRVVGGPGDLVEIKDGDLYVNGERQTKPEILRIHYENYSPGMKKPFFKERVPEGEVFVFGDNSPNSFDSRAWKGVPTGNVRGKAIFRFWPLIPWRVGLIR